MSFLKVALALVAVAIVSIAGPWWLFRSPEFRQFKRLEYPQNDIYAKSLPIERRLDLYKEVKAWSGHNPIDTVENDFDDQPAQTYEIIKRRIKSGDRSRYYAGVIFDIDGKLGFRICDQPDRADIQSYLASVAPDMDSPEFRRLYTC